MDLARLWSTPNTFEKRTIAEAGGAALLAGGLFLLARLVFSDNYVLFVSLQLTAAIVFLFGIVLIVIMAVRKRRLERETNWAVARSDQNIRNGRVEQVQSPLGAYWSSPS